LEIKIKIMIVQQKFKYGDHVIDHKNDHGIIEAVRFYHCKHFRPDAYLVEYNINRNPGFEDDDEFWASECNLKMYNS